MENKPCKMYTLNQVARILGVTPFTVRNWARSGKINAVKIPENTPKAQWFISCDEVNRLQNNNSERGKTE